MSHADDQFSRRGWLKATGGLILTSATCPLVIRASDSIGQSELIVRESVPPNLEMRFSSLDGFLTPSDQFYVRCHFPIPKLQANALSLKVEGRVATPFSISMAELRQLPSTTITAVMECAGNGRVSLVPKVRGVAWDQGAVGNVKWTGVSLNSLLERAGVDPLASEVLMEGADSGSMNDDPKSPGEIRYDRSIPLLKARKDVILAYQMNGEDLTPSHGFPLRAVVPGWYGMASVKWLTRLVVLDRSYNGFFQSLDYAYFDRVSGAPSLTPLTSMQVKAQIARPFRMETVKRSSKVRVHGAAWSGGAGIAMVEFSSDGNSWEQCKLIGEQTPNAWRLFEHTWNAPELPGIARLHVRATDTTGNTQPATRSPDRRTYMINHVVPTEVQVV